MFTLWVYECVWGVTMCVCGVNRGQKRSSEPLKLDLQVVVSQPRGVLGTDLIGEMGLIQA